MKKSILLRNKLLKKYITCRKLELTHLPSQNGPGDLHPWINKTWTALLTLPTPGLTTTCIEQATMT